MHCAVFNTKSYDRRFLEAANAAGTHRFTFLEPRLTAATCRLAEGHPAICTFVNDVLDEPTLRTLAAGGTWFVALRCAGYNQVDLDAAERLGMRVARVPAYSPHAVAEHTVGLMLALARRLPKAYNRVREGNFSLEGLLGFDFHGRTAGVIGTGKIGAIVARLLAGFGCRVLLHDPFPDAGLVAEGARYVPLDELFAAADVITLHCPLTPESQHLIGHDALAKMKPGVMLINTSRGVLLDTSAVIHALKQGHVGYLGIDVYEEEADLFFEDLSQQVIQDDVFSRLLTFPNVLITGHQAFFTHEALAKIAAVTIENLTAFERGGELVNEVSR